MKKITTLLAIALLSLTLQAQDMKMATELYNKGATALSENNYGEAIDSFEATLKMLGTIEKEELGEEGESLISEVKAILPQIYLRQGKELASFGEVEESLPLLEKASKLAKEYGVDGIDLEVETLLPQILMAHGSSLLNGGKIKEAIDIFEKLIEIDGPKGDAYLRIGLAQSRLDNEEAAIEAFEKAIEAGESANAPRQLSVIFLKRAAAAVKTKEWGVVNENAKKSNSFSENANAFKLIGISALQQKRYDEAIEAIDSYLLKEPDAKDKNNMLYNLAVSYEAKGNNAKACGYYKAVKDDPTYKAMAEYKINTQLKCN